MCTYVNRDEYSYVYEYLYLYYISKKLSGENCARREYIT
jgi:hypothetical protein